MDRWTLFTNEELFTLRDELDNRDSADAIRLCIQVQAEIADRELDENN